MSIYKLYNFSILCLLTSYTSIAQSFTATSESSKLNITRFGVIKSWTKTADPLGRPVSYTEFNNAKSDTADIGVFWWEARDIERIEVIYAVKPSDITSLPIIQYWHQTWPEPYAYTFSKTN